MSKLIPLNDEESWEMRYDTLPRILGKISDLSSIRNEERKEFIQRLEKFLEEKEWKKEK